MLPDVFLLVLNVEISSLELPEVVTAYLILHCTAGKGIVMTGDWLSLPPHWKCVSLVPLHRAECFPAEMTSWIRLKKKSWVFRPPPPPPPPQ